MEEQKSELRPSKPVLLLHTVMITVLVTGLFLETTHQVHVLLWFATIWHTVLCVSGTISYLPCLEYTTASFLVVYTFLSQINKILFLPLTPLCIYYATVQEPIHIPCVIYGVLIAFFGCYTCFDDKLCQQNITCTKVDPPTEA